MAKLFTGWSEGGRRPMCIILDAGPGDVRAARGLVGKAIRSVLKIRRWGERPHDVTYYSRDEMPQGEDPRFTLYATSAEGAAISSEIRRLSNLEGWPRPPVDIYHD